MGWPPGIDPNNKLPNGKTALDDPFTDPGPKTIKVNGANTLPVVAGAPNLSSPWSITGKTVTTQVADADTTFQSDVDAVARALAGPFAGAVLKNQHFHSISYHSVTTPTGEYTITGRPMYLSEDQIYEYCMNYSIFTQPNVNAALKAQYKKFLEDAFRKDIRVNASSWKYRDTLPHPTTRQELAVPDGVLTRPVTIGPSAPFPMKPIVGMSSGMLYYIPVATWRQYEYNIANQVAATFHGGGGTGSGGGTGGGKGTGGGGSGSGSGNGFTGIGIGIGSDGDRGGKGVDNGKGKNDGGGPGKGGGGGSSSGGGGPGWTGGGGGSSSGGGSSGNGNGGFVKLTKPGDVSGWLDSNDGTIDTNTDYDPNQFVDNSVGIDLTKIGISKESMEIVGLGSIPVMYYSNKVNNWRYLLGYTVASPLLAYGVTKIFHEPMDYSLKEWNAKANSDAVNTLDTFKLAEEWVQNMQYVATKGATSFISTLKSPAYLGLIAVSGIPIGYAYYKNRQPIVLVLYSVYALSVPWIVAAVEKFAKDNMIAVVGVCGVGATIAVASLLYATKLVPEVLIGEIGAAGFGMTALACIGIYLTEGAETLYKDMSDKIDSVLSPSSLTDGPSLASVFKYF
jgi:hypothetical protein